MAARVLPALTCLAIIVAVSDAAAQQRRDIFANPENLKVLPKDISSEELRSIMRGFALQLDLRCSSCHVGEEDQSIFDYDFAADKKERKLIAREMLKMVKDINKRVARLDRGADHQFVEVTCITCHRSQNRPRMIEDVVADEYEEGGVDQLIAKYQELRDRHYGGFTFDFSAFRLAEIGMTVAKTSPGDALRVHQLNVELNPNAGAAYAGRGMANQQLERPQEALDDFRKATELDADFAYLKPRIEELEKQIAGQ